MTCRSIHRNLSLSIACTVFSTYVYRYKYFFITWWLFDCVIIGVNMTPTQILALLVTATILTVPAVLSYNDSPQIYDQISYELDLRLNHELFTSTGTEFSGKLKIRFSFTHETEYITLHCNSQWIHLDKIIFDGIPINNNSTRNRLGDIVEIPLKSQVTIGFRYELYIEYTGKINTEDPEAGTGLYKSSYIDNFGISNYLLITQFAPTYARTVFPCFDEPEMKAIFSVSIQIPSYLNVIFNTRVKETLNLDKDGLKTVIFMPTSRMSTYMVGFVVFDFTCTIMYINKKINFEVCSRDEFVKKGNFALETTFELLTEYNEFINYNYSRAIGKLNVVAIPDSLMVMSRETSLLSEVMAAVPYFRPSVTKAWSFIIHKESELFSEDSEYFSENLAVALGISRELAYRWFGNVITANWWSQIFVNRVLAAYFETYITNEVMEWVENHFIVNILHETLVYDALDDIEPLYYEDTHMEYINGSYSNMSYNKGGIIMRMVRYFMGLENFWRGIRNYAEKHTFDNVDINNLWNALEECIDDSVSHMPAKLSTVMENWIDYKGYPVLNVSYSEGHVRVSQSKFVYHDDHLVNDQTKWYIPISYTIANQPNSFQKTTPYTWLTPKEDYISFPLPENQDTNWVILNNHQTGYYRVYYDEKLLDGINYALESSRFESVPEINRAHIVDDLFNFARANLMRYEDVFKAINFLKYDRSYYPWKAAMDGFGFILRRYGYTSQIGKDISKHILELMENYFHEPVWLVDRNNRIDKLKQQLAEDWACRLNVSSCIKDSAESFKLYTELNIGINKWLKNTVLCSAVRHCKDFSCWGSLFRQYEESNSSKEQEVILPALGCSRHPKLLNELLKQSITEGSKFRFEDVIMVYIQTENNAEAIKALLTFLIEHQEYIIRNYQSPDLLEYIFVGIGERLEWPELQDLRSYIEKGLKGKFKEYGAKALRAANESKKWVDKHRDELQHYYNLDNSYGYGPILISIAIVILTIIMLAVYKNSVRRHRHRVVDYRRRRN